MAAAQKVLWYIESRFGAHLALSDVAHVVGVSPFHLSRIFHAATGWPVVRYLRARRLTEAARQLAAGAPDILSLALATGYGSHEAFTRAFRDQFGTTPGIVRQRASLQGLALVEALRVMQEPSPPAQTPRIESAGPLRIAGICARYDRRDTAGIPAQWQRLERVTRARSGYCYGVCSTMTTRAASITSPGARFPARPAR